MASDFRMEHRVEFADTDMAGIMHFANFFRFMERTEHSFLRSLGFSVHQRLGERTIGWPRVHVHCDYRKPLRFEDDFEVQLLVREKREKALTYEFIFRKGTEEVARGGFTTVCVAWDEASHTMKSTPIPAELAAQVEATVDAG